MKNTDICILLSSYNGEKYIREQISSILLQERVNLRLIIRDDGSTDSTLTIVKEISEKDKRVILLNDSNNIGITQSFLILVDYAINNYPDCNVFFFADQDDVWLPEKCFAATEKINNGYDLYFSNKIVVDENLNVLFEERIPYLNLLWDYCFPSNASGCTMALSRSICSDLVKCRFFNNTFLHDAIAYRLAMFTSCKIYFDEKRYILYRQHDNNVVGGKKRSMYSILKRLFGKRTHYLSTLSECFLNSSVCPCDEKTKIFIWCIASYNKNKKAKEMFLNMIKKEKNLPYYRKLFLTTKVYLNLF